MIMCNRFLKFSDESGVILQTEELTVIKASDLLWKCSQAVTKLCELDTISARSFFSQRILRKACSDIELSFDNRKYVSHLQGIGPYIAE